MSYNGGAKINSPILPTILIHMPWYEQHQSVSESIGEECLLMAGLCGYDIAVTFDPLIMADCQLLKIHWLLQWVGRAGQFGGWWVMGAASQHMESLNRCWKVSGWSTVLTSHLVKNCLWQKDILPLLKLPVASSISIPFWFSGDHLTFSRNQSPGTFHPLV